MTPEIQKMHSLFCQLTNVREWRLGYQTVHAWAEWMRDFGEKDLRLIVSGTARFNRRHPDRNRSLRFDNIIQNPDKCRGWLNEYETDERERQAKSRRPTMDRNRAEVLRATGRQDELPLADSRTSAQILHSNSFFEAMRKAVEAGTGS